MSRADRLARARARLLAVQYLRDGLTREEQAELDAIETAIAMDQQRAQIIGRRAGLRLAEVTS